MPLFRKREKETDASSQTPTPMKETKFEIADWRKVLPLRDGEYVVLKTENVGYAPSRETHERFAEMANKKGDFVLTNQRLVFLSHRFREDDDGKTVLTFELQKDFPLESIKDVEYRSEEVIIHTDEGEYGCGNILWIGNINVPTHHTPEVFFNIFRKQLIEQKEKRATATIDFSFLKHTLEKGGIVLTTLTCPKCNGPLKLPPDGTETVCEHCGSTVYAQDIFKKLRTLLS